MACHSNFLKTIKNLIISALTKLINHCLKENVSPNTLKSAIVVPIFKKGDREDVSNYRPVSLLPIPWKVVERCIDVKMTEYFEGNGLFSERQFGFRSGRGTILPVLDMLSSVMDAFEDRKYSASVFLDLSKAFDCLS